MSGIRIEGDRLRVHFQRFDLENYDLFLRCKRLPEYGIEYHTGDETYTITAPRRFASMLGVEAPAHDAGDLPFSDFLFDDQLAITRTALEAKRFAVWASCGQGKTIIALEYARHIIHRTGGRVLVITLNEIVPQWIEEAQKFYGDSLPIVRLRTRQQMRQWCEHGPGNLAVTNYEKMNPEDLDHQVVTEMKHLTGIILDENRVKTGGGKQKWALIKSCRGIEYKLSLTATPAPNEIMEFASQASFLEKMRSEGEIIWTYFVRDQKTHRWTVRKHARKAFFEFMSSWSIYVQDPRRYGWRKGFPDIPAPIFQEHEIAITEQQKEWLTRLSADPSGQMQLPAFNDKDPNAIERNKLSQVAKGFCYRKGANGRYDRIDSRKPQFVAELIRREVATGAQVLVWTVFDAESDILAELLSVDSFGFDLLTGKTKEKDRLTILDNFRQGKSRLLISRAAMLGWGLNFQFVESMIFSGWSDSFEQLYQAVRRAYRFGQVKRLRVHFPMIPELEGHQYQNIMRKQREHERSITDMEENYIRFNLLKR